MLIRSRTSARRLSTDDDRHLSFVEIAAICQKMGAGSEIAIELSIVLCESQTGLSFFWGNLL